MTIHVYLLEWHINLSPAFHEIFINLLKGHVDVREVAWNGKEVLPEWLDPKADDIFVFCQRRPPTHVFASQPNAKVVWLPMWNNVQRMSASDWAAIPKTIRILAYSPLISERSAAAGLATLQVRYAPDPEKFAPVSWSQGSVLYYWNRVGLVGKAELIRLCQEMQIKKIMFRPFLDPGIPKDREYTLSTEEAGITVETVPFFDSAASANEFVSQANVVIAPRPSEGVGLAFLEAMAAGKAVLSVDRPTMSEYIEPGRTGILLRARRKWFERKPMLSATVSGRQDWSLLKAIDLEKIGQNARAQVADIHKAWLTDVTTIRSFVLDWSAANTQAFIVPETEIMTEAQIGELHRLAWEAMSVQRLAPFFMKKLRALREQLHPLYKKDLRTIKLKSGLKLQVNLGDHMGCDFYYGLFGEQQDFDLFMSAVKRGTTVVDVGANVGIYTITAARRSGPGGRVLAFEPGTAARELLIGNVARNKQGRIAKIFGACVGDRDGVIDFYESADSAMSGIQDTHRGGETQRIQYPLTTLDTALDREGVKSIDALKIDVEGAESLVLSGAAQILDRSDPVVMIEISAKNMPAGALDALRAVLVEIESKGFRFLRIMPNGYGLRVFERVGDIFEQPGMLINGNYFFARTETGKFNTLVKAYRRLAPKILVPHRVFPGRPRSRLNYIARNQSILWAERQKAKIAYELIATLSQASNQPG